MKCVGCGNEVDQAMQFCPKCGKEMNISHEENLDKKEKKVPVIPMNDLLQTDVNNSEVTNIMEESKKKKHPFLIVLCTLIIVMIVAGVCYFILREDDRLKTQDKNNNQAEVKEEITKNFDIEEARIIASKYVYFNVLDAYFPLETGQIDQSYKVAVTYNNLIEENFTRVPSCSYIENNLKNGDYLYYSEIYSADGTSLGNCLDYELPRVINYDTLNTKYKSLFGDEANLNKENISFGIYTLYYYEQDDSFFVLVPITGAFSNNIWDVVSATTTGDELNIIITHLELPADDYETTTVEITYESGATATVEYNPMEDTDGSIKKEIFETHKLNLPKYQLNFIKVGEDYILKNSNKVQLEN